MPFVFGPEILLPVSVALTMQSVSFFGQGAIAMAKHHVLGLAAARLKRRVRVQGSSQGGTARGEEWQFVLQVFVHGIPQGQYTQLTCACVQHMCLRLKQTCVGLEDRCIRARGGTNICVFRDEGAVRSEVLQFDMLWSENARSESEVERYFCRQKWKL